MYYVYVLRSKKNNSYYVGSCKNISQRINMHNHGLVKSTKRYLPWELIHRESFNNLSSARKKEIQLKSWKKRTAIENLIKSRISR